MPGSRHPNKASDEEIEQSKKNCRSGAKNKIKIENSGKTVRLMFEDEASFGRINKPKYCWCNNKFRPCVSCHYIREYRYAFGAVESLTEERFFFSYAKLQYY